MKTIPSLETIPKKAKKRLMKKKNNQPPPQKKKKHTQKKKNNNTNTKTNIHSKHTQQTYTENVPLPLLCFVL